MRHFLLTKSGKDICCYLSIADVKIKQNMYLIDIIPLTKIPHTLPQILSYFYPTKLPLGALVLVPLGRRQEEGLVVANRDVASHKMEIKSASFELRNINKIISSQPILTDKQIALALSLGLYYLCSPGVFAKMMLPRHNFGEGGLPARKKSKAQKLIIVPTVLQALSFYKSAPARSVVWHSDLTQKQKENARSSVRTGQAKTIIGTRSAVFLPFADLKEIIIEDAASPSHKSWDMWPHYDSRTVAQKLAELYKAKLSLKNSPAANGYLPPNIIDMRQELQSGNFSIFSISLYEAMKKALAAKQQIVLFINRRGAANFILCRDCGYVVKCSNCEAPLAYHLINNKPLLLCHHCGQKDAPPGRCPKCHSIRIKTVGSGTQKIESETKKFFPDAKILRLDSDNASKSKDQKKIIEGFAEQKADILIATPMLFSWQDNIASAKPAVIGMLSADTLLHIPDFRSGERAWQTILGLSNLNPQANFFLQTYNPDNSFLKYVRDNDHKGFLKEDTETRQALNYPPFSQIVKLTIRHRDAKRAGQEAKILQTKLQRLNKNERIEISAALPAFVPREHGKFVWNIILKFILNKQQAIIDNEFIQNRNLLLQYVPSNWEIDIDPENI